MRKSGANLISDLLIFNPGPICTYKKPFGAKSNFTVHWKLRTDRTLFLTDLDIPMANLEIPNIVKILSFLKFITWHLDVNKGYLWSKFQIIMTLCTGFNAKPKRPKNSTKRAISWMLNWYKNIWKFLTWQPQMLQQWDVQGLCILIRSFLFTRNLGVTCRA